MKIANPLSFPPISVLFSSLMTRYAPPPRGEGTPYNDLYGNAPPFFGYGLLIYSYFTPREDKGLYPKELYHLLFIHIAFTAVKRDAKF